MAKFLNETGLSHFWSKIKEFLKSKYVAINDNITISDGKSDKVSLNPHVITVAGSGEVRVTTNDGEKLVSTSYDGITIKDSNSGDFSTLTNQSFVIGDNDDSVIVGISKERIIAPNIVRKNGTSSQVLLANGSIATLNAANGIPKLDANGRIPLSQLANLDTTLFQVVTALPTSGIKSNRIYLLRNSTTGNQNLYTEYVYTGNVSSTYDASKWEKLGEYKADIDLSPYSKKNETVNGVTAGTSTATNAVIKVAKADSTSTNVNIPAATTSAAGVMTGADKKALDTLTSRYPLSITGFTVSPSLLEVGATSDVTYNWTLGNTDFHPITLQTINVNSTGDVTTQLTDRSYKKTGLVGPNVAATLKATLTVNKTLTKDVHITYHYPSYIGVVSQEYALTETNLKKLTKSIEWGKGKTATLTTNNQIAVYAYPASYGDLTSIKDGNGFEGFAGYTKTTVTFANGVVYNVYTQKLPATASSKYTFA